MSEVYLYERKLKKDTDYNVWMCFPGCTAFSLASLGYLWLYKAIDETENIDIEKITKITELTKEEIENIKNDKNSSQKNK